MSEQLLSKLVPRLKRLDQGAYERAYRFGRKTGRTSTHQVIGDLFDSLGIEYKSDVKVSKYETLRADFLVKGTLVFVDRDLSDDDMRILATSRRKSILVRKDSLRSDRFDHGIRIIGLEEEGRQQTIFLDDPSFNFDYAHILPKTRKCSVMHGHTSSVLVEVVGRPIEGMVVDFGIAKQIVREAVRELDHKLFINQNYVTEMDSRYVSLQFETVHGEFGIRAPRGTTVLLPEEATVENLAKEVLNRITPKMPKNVTAVGVYVYEGLNKGSHILAKIHQDGARPTRRKR